MNELELKYGCNPNQKPSRIYMEDGSELPIKVLNGRPGYINFLDAFNGWQLVKELKEALEGMDDNCQLEIENIMDGKELYVDSIMDDSYNDTVTIFVNEYVSL